jgi:hypothetical protein
MELGVPSRKKPSQEEMFASATSPWRIVQLLLDTVHTWVPQPWNHELDKREYGAFWNSLVDMLEQIRSEVELAEFNRSHETVQEYGADFALGNVAGLLYSTAARYDSHIPRDVVLSIARAAEDQARGLRNHRAEPITDDGKQVLVGHIDGVSVQWADKMTRPAVVFEAHISPEVIDLAYRGADVFEHVYRAARRAVTKKMIEDGNKTAGPVEVKVVVSQDIRP